MCAWNPLFFNAVHYIIIEQEWPGKVRVTGISVDFKQLDHSMYYIFPLKTIVILPLKFHHKAKYTLQRVEQWLCRLYNFWNNNSYQKILYQKRISLWDANQFSIAINFIYFNLKTKQRRSLSLLFELKSHIRETTKSLNMCG